MSLDLRSLAKNSKISDDTFRRLKYPMLTQVDEQGRTKFLHDIGITEGRLSSLSVDRGEGHISEVLLREEQAQAAQDISRAVTDAPTASRPPA